MLNKRRKLLNKSFSFDGFVQPMEQREQKTELVLVMPSRDRGRTLFNISTIQQGFAHRSVSILFPFF